MKKHSIQLNNEPYEKLWQIIGELSGYEGGESDSGHININKNTQNELEVLKSVAGTLQNLGKWEEGKKSLDNSSMIGKLCDFYLMSDVEKRNHYREGHVRKYRISEKFQVDRALFLLICFYIDNNEDIKELINEINQVVDRIAKYNVPGFVPFLLEIDKKKLFPIFYQFIHEMRVNTESYFNLLERIGMDVTDIDKSREALGYIDQIINEE